MGIGPKSLPHKRYWSLVSGLERLRRDLAKSARRQHRLAERLIDLAHSARGSKARRLRVARIEDSPGKAAAKTRKHRDAGNKAAATKAHQKK